MDQSTAPQGTQKPQDYLQMHKTLLPAMPTAETLSPPPKLLSFYRFFCVFFSVVWQLLILACCRTQLPAVEKPPCLITPEAMCVTPHHTQQCSLTHLSCRISHTHYLTLTAQVQYSLPSKHHTFWQQQQHNTANTHPGSIDTRICQPPVAHTHQDTGRCET